MYCGPQKCKNIDIKSLTIGALSATRHCRETEEMYSMNTVYLLSVTVHKAISCFLLKFFACIC